MPDPTIKVLDTANPTASPSDDGPAQFVRDGFLKKDKPLRLSVDLGSGDTIIIEGRSSTDEDYETLHTFTDETPADVYVSRYWRARRSVDGGGDSQVFVENSYNLKLTEDAAS